MEAAEAIELLELRPHPEGGHYRETHRDRPADGGRGHSSAIYFLLEGGQVNRWHRVDAVEVWHWYAGAPLALSTWPGDGTARRTILGQELGAGERPQAIVPARVWQSARALGAWTLVGCTVAPAFEFAGFELAPADWRPPAGPPVRRCP